jgi:hypothetical protein
MQIMIVYSNRLYELLFKETDTYMASVWIASLYYRRLGMLNIWTRIELIEVTEFLYVCDFFLMVGMCYYKFEQIANELQPGKKANMSN